MREITDDQARAEILWLYNVHKYAKSVEAVEERRKHEEEIWEMDCKVSVFGEEEK